MKRKKLIIIAITAVAILTAGLICRQSFFLMLPLFVSLFVMAFQSEANRLGALMGALNSIIYTAAYIILGLYGSAASAILFSFPMQFMTFFMWRKRAYKKTVVFRRMSVRARILFFSGLGILWAVLTAVFAFGFNYEYALLESITFILGFVVPVLTMLAFIEYTYLWIVSAAVNIFLSIQMVVNDYRQTTYLIYAVYCVYCIIGAYASVRRLYNEQQTAGDRQAENEISPKS